MKLHIQQDYACSEDTFWEMYWADDFSAMLQEGSTVDTEVLEESDENDVYTRRLRFTPHTTLPMPVAKLVGSDKLIYEQQNAFYRNKNELTWEVIPTILPGKLQAKGVMKTESTPNGCKLIIDGDIQVNVRFVGGRIESAVVEEVTTSYQRLPVAAKQWLAEHGRNT